MKHSNFTFFFWGYYPKRNHTMEASKDFFHRVYQGWILDGTMDMDHLGRMITSFYEDCQFNIHINITPGSDSSEFLPHSLALISTSTGGFRQGDPNYLPQFHREDCISLEIISQDPIGRKYWETRINGYMRIIELFCKAFDPIFICGHKDYNRWWDDSFSRSCPESRLWPYNMYNLGCCEEGFLDRLRLFSDGSDWLLDIIEERYAVLHASDLTLDASENDSTTSQSVLGCDHATYSKCPK